MGKVVIVQESWFVFIPFLHLFPSSFLPSSLPSYLAYLSSFQKQFFEKITHCVYNSTHRGFYTQDLIFCLMEFKLKVWIVFISLLPLLVSLVAHLVKNLPVVQETRFDPWVRKVLWRRKWQSTPVPLSGKSPGQRSLVGCSPWGRKDWP